MDRSLLYDYSDGSRFIGKSAEAIFNDIAANNLWNEKESMSGPGSTADQTSEIRRVLPQILTEYGIKSLFDVPCGDFNWMCKIDLSNIQYTGGDIVKKIILQNTRRYKRQNLKFIHFNLLEMPFDAVDLIFCRDGLVHFSYEDIFKTLKIMKKSQSLYLMITTFPGQKTNKNVPTGGWRPLNFEKEPFLFKPPDFLLNERCMEFDGVFADKSLGLWRLADIKI